MKANKLLSVLIIFILSFSLLNAQPTKMGKFLGAKDTTMPSWFLNSFLDLNEDITELSQNNKRLILFIHQPNCPYCHRFVTKNLEQKDIRKKLDTHFGIIDINMYGDREITDIDGQTYTEKEFAIKHKVQFTPTLIFFDEEAKQILRLNGYMPIKKFDMALNFIKDKKEKTISYKEYMANNSKVKELKNSAHKLFMKSSKILRRDTNNKPLAVFFESKNCTECTKLHDLFLEDKTIQSLISKIDIAKIDTNEKQTMVTPDKIIIKTQEWLKNLKITYDPSIVFFDNKGKEIIRIESNFKKFHLQSIVDYIVSQAYKNEPEFQRYLTKRANAIRAKGIDVNIWE